MPLRKPRNGRARVKAQAIAQAPVVPAQPQLPPQAPVQPPQLPQPSAHAQVEHKHTSGIHSETSTNANPTVVDSSMSSLSLAVAEKRDGLGGFDDVHDHDYELNVRSVLS